MCIFQTLKFENYTEQPRIKPDYYLEGETTKAYRKRQRVQQREEAARNIALNATGKEWKPRYTEQLTLLKVADDNKPEYIATSGTLHGEEKEAFIKKILG